MNNNTVELDILGMDCPACALKIEKAVSRIEGVENIEVNLGSETASINFKNIDFDISAVKEQIKKLGYEAVEPENDLLERDDEEKKHSLLKKIRRKIYISISLTLIIVLLGMKEHIPLFSPLSADLANLISLFLSTIVVFWCGQKFFKGFYAALKAGTADMDTLIVIGTVSAYLYSLAVILFPNISGSNSGTVYFESAAMIITFLLLGNYLEMNLKNKTHYAIKSLMSLQAKYAVVVKNGKEVEIPMRKLKLNDIVLVKPGEKIPVDGIIIEGNSTVDESMITGESVPNDKLTGANVIGGTINLNGYLKIKTEKIGKETFLSKIIILVKNAQKSKPEIQRIGDKVSAIFVPVVILIAIITFIIWNFFVGQAFNYSLLKAVSVLIIACPCALGLATPIAIVLGVGRAAENKILFNNAEAIENVSKIDTIVFDKTGTLTHAKFEVKKIIQYNNNGTQNSRTEILKKAASLENYSEHPIARAIVEHYKTTGSNSSPRDFYDVEEFKIIPGIGVEAKINHKSYKLGGVNLIEKDKLFNSIERNESESSWEYSNLYLFEENILIGKILIADRVKENAGAVIQKLRDEKYNLALISGDNKYATKKIADEVGISEYQYNVLPDKKQEIIVNMQKENRIIAMVGDGINDAPSLAKADLGIAIGTGQDIAIQSADVILVSGELNNLLALFKISNKTIRIIKQNLFWAFFYNAAAIPLAAGIFVPFGISISPVMASMIMAFSDIITVLGNSLRLKYAKIS